MAHKRTGEKVVLDVPLHAGRACLLFSSLEAIYKVILRRQGAAINVMQPEGLVGSLMHNIIVIYTLVVDFHMHLKIQKAEVRNLKDPRCWNAPQISASL